MAVDKLHFLTGKLSDLTNKPISRGDVYFAIDGEKGQIIFDAPINSSITKRIVMSGFESAESDSAGNVFINKYPFYFNTESTGTSFKIKITSFSKDDVSTINIVNADANHAGLITNAAQNITGVKTFKTGVTIDKTAGFIYSGIQTATANANRTVWFSDDTVAGRPVRNANFTYNPSTKTLVAENITGKASQAIADSAGNEFISNYPYTFELDNEKTSIIVKAPNTDTLFTLSPRFLPLNGGHITGSLLVDDLTAGELLVNGAARIIGDLYANLTGNVVGNVTGNVTGNLTGIADQAVTDRAGHNFITTYPFAFSQNSAKTNLVIKTPDGSNFGTYTFNFLPLTGGTLTGDLIIKKTTTNSNAYDGTGPQIVFQNSAANQNIKLLFSDHDTIQSPASLTLIGNQGGEYFIAPNIKATSNFYGNLKGKADEATLADKASIAMLLEGTLFIGENKQFTGASDVYIGETLYYVVGSDSDAAGTWTGTNSAITSYYEGLTIIYVPKKAGASTTTLNINGLGAVTCYYTNTSKLTTHFAVNTPIILTYYNNGWRRADYDSNTSVRIYKDENGTYPLIGSRTAAASITSGSTTVYGEISSSKAITMTPSTGTITATNFSGLASQASHDSAGNEFISKYPYLFQETVGTTDYKIHISSVSQDIVKVKDTSGNEVNNLVVPAASVDNAGLLTNGAQILSGLKTFTNTGNQDAGIVVENTDSSRSNKISFINAGSGNSGIWSYKQSKWVAYINTAGNAYFKGTADLTNGVNATPASGDDEFTHVWFSDNTTETKRVSDDKFIYNSGTKTLNVNQYRINDHGLIFYDANTESIVFSFV